jgi:hypothetical protein
MTVLRPSFGVVGKSAEPVDAFTAADQTSLPARNQPTTMRLYRRHHFLALVPLLALSLTGPSSAADLYWDGGTTNIAAFSLADRDRWLGAPASAGYETAMDPLETLPPELKSFAFTADTVSGATLTIGSPSRRQSGPTLCLRRICPFSLPGVLRKDRQLVIECICNVDPQPIRHASKRNPFFRPPPAARALRPPVQFTKARCSRSILRACCPTERDTR